jgi:hypothetical protein
MGKAHTPLGIALEELLRQRALPRPKTEVEAKAYLDELCISTTNAPVDRKELAAREYTRLHRLKRTDDLAAFAGKKVYHGFGSIREENEFFTYVTIITLDHAQTRYHIAEYRTPLPRAELFEEENALRKVGARIHPYRD